MPAVVRKLQSFIGSDPKLPLPRKAEPLQGHAPVIARSDFGNEAVHALVDEGTEHQLLLRAGIVADENAVLRQPAAVHGSAVGKREIKAGI